MSDTATPAAPVIMYSTSWCGYCQRLKAQMGRAGIGWEEINIESDPQAEATVKAVNGGNATVPTLVFADGSALTNPTIKQVQQQLAEMR